MKETEVLVLKWGTCHRLVIYDIIQFVGDEYTTVNSERLLEIYVFLTLAVFALLAEIYPAQDWRGLGMVHLLASLGSEACMCCL